MQKASIQKYGGVLEVATEPKLLRQSSHSIRVSINESQRHARRQPTACAAWISRAALIFFAVLAGCSSHSEFEKLDDSKALERLGEVLGTTEPSRKLLLHGLHPVNGSEFWIITVVSGLKFPPDSGAQGPTRCPADSIFSYAVSLGVPANSLEPEESAREPLGQPSNSLQGSLWQLEKDSFSVRIRQAPLKNGALVVVERLRENQ